MDLQKLYEEKCKLVDEIKSTSNEILYSLDKKTFCYYMSFLTSQSSEPKIERYLINKLDAVKIKSKANKGDMLWNDKYFEIKTSTINNTNKSVNLVQLRLWQKIDGYIIIIDINNNQFNNFHVLKLTKKQMIDECEKLNACSAHGTVDVTEKNEYNELRLSVKYNSDIYNEWLRKYKIDV